MHLLGNTLFSLLSLTLAIFSFFVFLWAVWTAYPAFHFTSKYLSSLPPAFHNFYNLLFSDISLQIFSFHHRICFSICLSLSTHKCSPCEILIFISTSTKYCSPEVSLIVNVEVPRTLFWRSACSSFHTCRFGTNFSHQSLLFTILHHK